MDLDGDGLRDVITGCWPGPLHIFRGKAEGGFAPSTSLTYADGTAIELGSASTVFAVDWERDGDLDLLVGNIDGEVFLVPNASGGKALELQQAVRVRAGGKPVDVANDSAPIVADWDGDGRQDLLVGSGAGSVMLYRGLVAEGEPLLSAGVTLVAGERGRPAATPAEVRVGSRTKVAVADWDGDGRPDLLVGDFGSSASAAPDLTPEQVKRRDELRAEQRELAQTYSTRWQALLHVAAKELGINIGTEQQYLPPKDKLQLQRLNERTQALLQADGDLVARYGERMAAIQQELQPLLPKHEMHGYVWFFRRLDAAAPAGDAPAPASATPADAPAATFPAPTPAPPTR